MRLKVLMTASLLVAMALPAAAGRNIIRNGNFDEGKGGEYGFPGWHTAIMGYMPRIVAKTDDGKSVFNYICSCGYNFGTKKVEAGVTCPKCRRYSVAEETGKWYDDNHKFVTLDRGRKGYGVKMLLNKSVGENQGTRCVSELVNVRRNWPYYFSVDARAKGAVIIVFVEGYRYVRRDTTADDDDDEDDDDEDDDDGDDDDGDEDAEGDDDDEKAEDAEAPVLPVKSYGEATAIEKCYRKQIPFGSPGGWKQKGEIFMPPPRYAIDMIQVKLYAFMPGEAYFDNVVVRPLSTYEAQKWLATRKKKKDKRFR